MNYKTNIGNKIVAEAKGNVKKSNTILVGDNVIFEKMYDKYIITKILDRKNQLIRPPVANIDNLIIVVSIKDPKPDYILLDKEIILCLSKGITPIICINKIDLDCQNEIDYIKKVYGDIGIEIICTSAKDNIGIDDLKKILRNKISAFSGNSGVGKSSISKKIINMDEILIGDIGNKSKKGKHTTKYVKLYNIEKDSYVLDTPGFSSFDLLGVSAKELKKYYIEFNNYECEYMDCNHINEEENICMVKQNVNKNNIDKSRYERYVYIYNLLKSKEDKKYK